MNRALSLLLLTATCAFAQMDDVAFIASLSQSNAAAFSPSDVSGLKLWVKSDAGVTSQSGNNSPVWRWADQSGNNNHLYNSTGSGATNFTAGPTYFTSGGPNNAPYLDITSGHMKTASSLAIAQPNTYFVVCRHSVTALTKFLFDSPDAGRNAFFFDATLSHMFAGTVANITGTDYSAYSVLTCVFNGASSSFRKNKTPIGGTLSVGASSMDTMFLGCATDTNARWAGPVIEVIVYNALVSSQNITNVENYLYAKYAL